MLYRNKYRSKKSPLISYFILLIILVVFIATIGIKILTGAILFIVDLATFTKRDNDVIKKSISIDLAPRINDIVSATNTASLNISGSAQSSSIVSIFVNNQQQHNFNLNEESFTKQIQLNPGDNQVYIIAKRQPDGQTKKSKNYIVKYLSSGPNLDIETPQDNQIFDTENIQINGSTDQNVNIKINNYPVIVSEDGSFTYKVTLLSGTNQINIIAQDQAKNETIKNISVIYEPD